MRNTQKEYTSHKKWLNDHKDEVNSYYRDYYEKNKDHMRELAKKRTAKYRQSHKEKVSQSLNKYRSSQEYKDKSVIKRKQRYELNKEDEKDYSRYITRRRKMEVLYWYTNGLMRCDVCGETHIEFLEVDHINNDGYTHRKQIGGSKYFYQWLIDNGFPHGYQVLCRNCNIKKVKLLSVGLNPMATPIQKANYKYHLKLRNDAISHYSNGLNKCECCGNSDIDVLCIDHINGNGNVHRRELGGKNLTQWIVKNNFPDGFRILCENCNKSHGLYGYCPHLTSTTSNDQINSISQS